MLGPDTRAKAIEGWKLAAAPSLSPAHPSPTLSGRYGASREGSNQKEGGNAKAWGPRWRLSPAFPEALFSLPSGSSGLQWLAGHRSINPSLDHSGSAKHAPDPTTSTPGPQAYGPGGGVWGAGGGGEVQRGAAVTSPLLTRCPYLFVFGTGPDEVGGLTALESSWCFAAGDPAWAPLPALLLRTGCGCQEVRRMWGRVGSGLGLGLPEARSVYHSQLGSGPHSCEL